MKVLYVETNFLLEHARSETPDAEKILAAAESGRIRLVLPIFCIYEAQQKQAREGPEREEWARKLADLGKNLVRKGIEAQRSTTFFAASQELRHLGEIWSRGLDETVARLRLHAEMLSLAAEALSEVELLAPKLAKGDPWLAAVIKLHHSGLARGDEPLFLERDVAVAEVANTLGIPTAGASAAVVSLWDLSSGTGDAPTPVATRASAWKSDRYCQLFERLGFQAWALRRKLVHPRLEPTVYFNRSRDGFVYFTVYARDAARFSVGLWQFIPARQTKDNVSHLRTVLPLSGCEERAFRDLLGLP